ncbi:DnaJ subfamily C member 4 [Liparis tanakae]|uniref:DnaJ subfamily C member 4 n=1 Tax=Liparis tanakae TaxID=230148 RepID=A0A4Z2FW19_9TELE|nr:DnaJ subfamily C member 4 [Liparis tanakae]
MQLEAQLRLCQSCLWCCKSGLRLLSQSYAQRKAVNYYDLLGVKSDASPEDIKHAFFDKSKKASYSFVNQNMKRHMRAASRSLVSPVRKPSVPTVGFLTVYLITVTDPFIMQLHPDSDPSNPALHSLFVELNEAYGVLSKDPSRKEYDFKMRRPYSGGQAFRSTSSNTSYTASADTQESFRYWEQFRQSRAQKMTSEEWQRRRRRNFRLVGYCFTTMMLGIGAHILLFRKLEELHNTFMDEKDRAIGEIYKESKERARANGFKKQTEILRQKHAEFLEKYNIPNNGDDK